MTDSDSFFNAWGVSARDAVEKFHKARHGKNILISAEPNCWNGSFCNKDVRQKSTLMRHGRIVHNLRMGYSICKVSSGHDAIRWNVNLESEEQIGR